VILVAEEGMGTLSAYEHRKVHQAPSGGPGRSNKRRGADAQDLRLPVPVGTVVRDAASGEILADLARPGVTYEAARGGRGGRGNASIAGGVERVPNFAERGEPGATVEVNLELRLVADVGLLGPPNAGKSTLLGAISRARPKVGDYPFTTIHPSLGVVERGESRIVVADLPGLIEGAAEGKGLGLRFLRHAERCAVLAAVVDAASPDPIGDLETVVAEAEAYETPLGDRVRVVVANKCDLSEARGDRVRSWARERGMRCLEISAMEGDGVDRLVTVFADEVETARAERGRPSSFAVFRPVAADRLVVTREGEGFRVASERVERLVGMTPLANPRAVRHLQRRLRSLGVDAALQREGARAGDEIRIGDTVFEYQPDV
jgi:GTP-binding protein